MIPISSALSGGLFWSKIPHQSGFQLNATGGIVGSFQKSNSWATEFQAESVHGNWKFRRTGCFSMGTEILDSATNAPIAIFRANWKGGGTLAFADGQTFRISGQGFWQSVWTVKSEDGRIVLNIHSRKKSVEIPGTVQVSEERLTLLAIFARYVMQKASEEAAAVAVVSVAG